MLISLLEKNRDSKDYPFHMPGHKRLPAGNDLLDGIYGIDITEIEGFDNLHNAEGIIKDSQERAANCYGADETHFLVNGSTGGIFAAITASVTAGDTIVIARNCHKSVYNAVMISGADMYVITPDEEPLFGMYGGIKASDVKEALTASGAKAVVITSPTYDGIVSNIEDIVKVCHEQKAVLIVDSAHGAHFGFGNGFPESAIRLGADVVITSVHKTLPSLTQTALIHINRNCPCRQRIQKMLPVFQTSSPSYVLMASIDHLTGLLLNKADELFAGYEKKLDDFLSNASQLKNLYVMRRQDLKSPGSFDLDKGKIVVGDMTGTYSGKELSDMLRNKYHLIPEMASKDYVLLMTGIADISEGFDRLSEALSDIDKTIDGSLRVSDGESKQKEKGRLIKNNMKSAMFEKTTFVSTEDAAGRISADLVTVYPPGIPVIIPGETITKEAVSTINEAKKNGLEVTGLNGKELTVVWERSST